MYEKILQRVRQFVLDCVFPIRCVGGCGRYDRWLCDDCRKHISPIPQPECPFCHRPQSTNLTCPDCSKQTALAGLFVRADYQQPLVQTCVHALKYQFIEELGASIGQELASGVATQQALISSSNQKPIVIPVPLHWQRKNERGFNQAETIARAFGQALDWPIRTDILGRTHYTSPQAQLARAERLANLTVAFRVKPGVVISGQTVILIDDVATTLATLEACAQTLRKAGAGKVWGVVFARSQQ
ncbi:MAG: ComF family protein [Patescibacteria group bacterium]